MPFRIFSNHRKTPLVRLQSRMNAHTYKNILQQNVLSLAHNILCLYIILFKLAYEHRPDSGGTCL